MFASRVAINFEISRLYFNAPFHISFGDLRAHPPGDSGVRLLHSGAGTPPHLGLGPVTTPSPSLESQGTWEKGVQCLNLGSRGAVGGI
ncbi:unnamed protein product [Bursaphelenchus xylophilus]|uniref:(pine wood nematode) hypothetical protein n=1 Tax=Bursaphelenchus xylophilus TaxID=6326 RepID=A0A1I7SUK3_BURXY|nr:unnamed protein product [Bursaphelenchus xylophilus]CAG9118634.1 unnamed protein product [Bursaphelenchus xylophilus]